MKKNKLSLLFIITLSCLLFSCDNSDNEPTIYQTLSTVRVLDNSKYLFIADEDTLYPKETINSYEAEDGQRALIRFQFIEPKTSNYDADINVINIQNYLTKNVIDLTPENQDSIGNDISKPYHISLSKDEYLNIATYIPISETPVLVNLINNTLETPNDNFTHLEFRMNNKSSSYNSIGKTIICFKLGNYAPSITGKSIKLKIKTEEGQEEYTIDKSKNDSSNQIESGEIVRL